MKTHELKTDPAVFDAVARGAKTHEIRYNDRDIQVGDFLLLRETAATGAQMQAGAELAYTGRTAKRTVSHIQTGYGLADGWCILSFAANPAIQAVAPIRRWEERIVDGVFVSGSEHQCLFPTGASARLAAMDAEIADLRAALAAVPAQQPTAEQPARITLTGHQLKEALELISPVGPDGAHDVNELENDLTFGMCHHRDDNGKEAFGMCCWNDDTDGVLPLDEDPVAVPRVGGEGGHDRQADERSMRIGEAVAHWGKWPDALPSGIMFFNGARITKAEFEARAAIARENAS